MESAPKGISPDELGEIYRRYAENDPEIWGGYNLVKKYSSGKIWGIGSRVYIKLIEGIYGINFNLKRDLDFLLEKPKEGKRLEPPKGWHFRLTQYGTQYLKKGKKRIDMDFLSNMVSDKESKIENFFPLVPFNIQAIAYDFENGIIIGEGGIDAISKRILKINNLQIAEETAKRNGLTLDDFVKKRLGILTSDQFKFRYVPD